MQGVLLVHTTKLFQIVRCLRVFCSVVQAIQCFEAVHILRLELFSFLVFPLSLGVIFEALIAKSCEKVHRCHFVADHDEYVVTVVKSLLILLLLNLLFYVGEALAQPIVHTS